MLLAGCRIGFEEHDIAADVGFDADTPDAPVDADGDSEEDRTSPTVIAASAVDHRTVRVQFSEELASGPSTTITSYCIESSDDDPTDCTQTSEFEIDDVTNRDGRSFDLSLSAALHERTYTVRVTGVADLAGNPIGNPSHASFDGAGSPPASFDDGPILSDPFGDGTAFSHVFGYLGLLHLGPSQAGTTAVRANPDGNDAELIDFRFAADTSTDGGSISENSSGAPYPSIGFTGCGHDTPGCGPDNEDGRGFYASGMIDDTEWLVIGGAHTRGNLDYIYMTTDSDQTLDFQYVDISENTGGATRGFSAMVVFAGRLYMGFPDSGGRRPYLVSLLTTPEPASDGLDALQNRRGGDACDPAAHDSCYLAAAAMPGIGASNGNDAATQLIDFFAAFNDRLYLGNNGGLVRSTTDSPLDAENSPGDWVSITPDASEYTPFESIATDKISDIEPADRAWPQAAELGGFLFIIRNTASGPQFWRCEPGLVSGPSPATADDCDAGDWEQIAGNTSGTTGLSQFNNGDNLRASLLVTNGAYLYVGFDNAVDGVVVYRTAAAAPSEMADFEGDGGCVAGNAGCEGLGGNGFGDPLRNTRFFHSTSLGFVGRDFLYVATGNGTDPVRVFRTSN